MFNFRLLGNPIFLSSRWTTMYYTAVVCILFTEYVYFARIMGKYVVVHFTPTLLSPSVCQNRISHIVCHCRISPTKAWCFERIAGTDKCNQAQLRAVFTDQCHAGRNRRLRWLVFHCIVRCKQRVERSKGRCVTTKKTALSAFPPRRGDGKIKNCGLNRQ